MLWFILPTILTIWLFTVTDRVHHYVPVLILSYICRDIVMLPIVIWCVINYLSLDK